MLRNLHLFLIIIFSQDFFWVQQVIFFGGVNKSQCLKLSAGNVEIVNELCSDQEEADERMLYHRNHAYNQGLRRALVISPDTDVFVFLLYHLAKNWNNEMKIFVKMGARKTSKIFPIHEVHKYMENSILMMLPGIHALTGCDTTSKVGNKISFINNSIDVSVLCGFGTDELSEEYILNAEKFLLAVLGHGELPDFNELRYNQYYKYAKLDFSKLACTSQTLKIISNEPTFNVTNGILQMTHHLVRDLNHSNMVIWRKTVSCCP